MSIVWSGKLAIHGRTERIFDAEIVSDGDELTVLEKIGKYSRRVVSPFELDQRYLILAIGNELSPNKRHFVRSHE